VGRRLSIGENFYLHRAVSLAVHCPDTKPAQDNSVWKKNRTFLNGGLAVADILFGAMFRERKHQ
jgi:hypothetical protein